MPTAGNIYRVCGYGVFCTVLNIARLHRFGYNEIKKKKIKLHCLRNPRRINIIIPTHLQINPTNCVKRTLAKLAGEESHRPVDFSSKVGYGMIFFSDNSKKTRFVWKTPRRKSNIIVRSADSTVLGPRKFALYVVFVKRLKRICSPIFFCGRRNFIRA